MDSDNKDYSQRKKKQEKAQTPSDAPLSEAELNRAHRPPPRFKEHVWEFLQNPDRYPSIAFTESALDVLDGHQDNESKGVRSVQTSGFFSTNMNLSGILPLSDWFTLTLTGGLAVSESVGQVGVGTQFLQDATVGTYLAQARFFLVGKTALWNSENNPDKWPSIGLTGSGDSTMQYNTGNTLNNGFQSINKQDWTGSLDTRIPVCDWYTIFPTLSGEYHWNQSLQIPNSNAFSGAITRRRDLSGTLEQRFYLVGKNLLFDDKGLNPDRWTSFYLIAGGAGSLSGDQQQTKPNGIQKDRGNAFKSITGSLGVRLPMTAHATIKLEADMLYSNTFLPENAAQDPGSKVSFAAGSRTRTFQMGGLASFRYYFF